MLVAGLEVRVPVCCSEVAHGVRCVGQAGVAPRVLLGVTGAPGHLLLLPSLKAGCFRVQVPLCGFRETGIKLYRYFYFSFL